MPMLVALLVALAAAAETSPPEPASSIRLSIIGTSDLHGQLGARDGHGGIAQFAGYIENLRLARADDGGAVVLLDCGDMFQGTLESNLGEGAAVIRAYNALGYDAAAIGNHEFDYGPAGAATTPLVPGDDPFGALRARIAEARFPLLAANLLERDTGRVLSWPGVRPSTLLVRGGVSIGVIGVTTAATLDSTLAENVHSLTLAPLAGTIRSEAQALRAAGAQVVVVLAHAGGRCTRFEDPADLSSCDPGSEIAALAAALPASLVDVILAGHTHNAMAHLINGIPVMQAWSTGRGFSRVDLTLEPGKPRVSAVRIHPPQPVCARLRAGTEHCAESASTNTSVPPRYEGREVKSSAAVAALVAPDLERALALATRSLGVRASTRISRSYDEESALGNLVADLMLLARPDADIALTNGGGLRADLRPGPISYGDLYELYPFDNRFARIKLKGRDLKRLLARNLGAAGGFWSLAGTTARASCGNGRLNVETRFADDEDILLVTSDFVATSSAFSGLAKHSIAIEKESNIRDEIARALERRGGRLSAREYYDPRRPRVELPSALPVRCTSPRRSRD